MTYAIVNDRLTIDKVPVPFVAANACGSRMLPELIVIHDTAGALDPLSSVNWFASPACKTSAHFVIERDGSVTQMVDCDVKAWHAGESSHEGRRYCNSYSIGIELVGPGALSAAGPGKAKAYYHKPGQSFAIAAYDIQHRSTPEHGDHLWMPNTPEQIEAVTQLCSALCEAYPLIRDVVGHYAISPGRKIDPSPLFPLAELRSSLFGKPDAPKPDTVSRRKVNVSRETIARETVPKVLTLGASGDDVRACQEALKSLGYPVGAVDGHFGPQMRVAVLAFEAENTLQTDGQLSAEDCALLLRIDATASSAVGEAKPKPMPVGAREEAPVVAGSAQQSDARLVKTVGTVITTGGLVEVGGELISGVSVLEKTQETAGAVSRATKAVAPILSGLQPKYIAVALGLALGLALYLLGRRIEWRRLIEHRTGSHLGR